jgi:hypothetical protein
MTTGIAMALIALFLMVAVEMLLLVNMMGCEVLL